MLGIVGQDFADQPLGDVERPFLERGHRPGIGRFPREPRISHGIHRCWMARLSPCMVLLVLTGRPGVTGLSRMVRAPSIGRPGAS